jgi:hypothetical protein
MAYLTETSRNALINFLIFLFENIEYSSIEEKLLQTCLKD